MTQGERLFNKYDFHSTIRNAPGALAKAVDALADSELFAGDQGQVRDGLVAAHVIRVPVLDLEATKPTEREVEIDLSRNPHERFMRDLTGPYYVKATEISFRVPFKGDGLVFYCQPSTFSLTGGPCAGIEGDAIVIRVIRQDQNSAEFRKAFDTTIQEIQINLERLRSDCKDLENTLRQTAESHLAQRREKRQKDKGLIEGLGFGKAK